MSRPPFVTLPAGIRSYRLDTDRGAFAVLDASPPAGLPTRGAALLVPGFTGSKEDFVALLGPLAAAGFRAVAVDGRGQYETGGPADEAAYALRELAADVVAQSTALTADDAVPLHLLGHSLGGLIVRETVIGSDPPLRWASVTILSSGPAAIDTPQQERTKMLVEALPALGLEGVWQVMGAMEEDSQSAAEPGVPAALKAFLRRRWLANVPEQLMATGKHLISEPDRVDELAAVPVRKLVMSGAVDYAWPVPWLDDMAVRLGAERVVIQGAEHSPNAERPAETAAALLDFWSRQDVLGPEARESRARSESLREAKGQSCASR